MTLYNINAANNKNNYYTLWFNNNNYYTFWCYKNWSSEFWSQVKSAIFADKVPTCDVCGGVVKPDIVFFGEDLPQRFKDLLQPDLSKCDLLIVMGTSLKVQPFAGLIHRVDQTTPRVLVSWDQNII